MISNSSSSHKNKEKYSSKFVKKELLQRKDPINIKNSSTEEHSNSHKSNFSAKEIRTKAEKWVDSIITISDRQHKAWMFPLWTSTILTKKQDQDSEWVKNHSTNAMSDSYWDLKCSGRLAELIDKDSITTVLKKDKRK